MPFPSPPSGALAILPSDPSRCVLDPAPLFETLRHRHPTLTLQSTPTAETRALIYLPRMDDATAPDRLHAILTAFPSIVWIQLPMCGIDAYTPMITNRSSEEWKQRVWCSGKVPFDPPSPFPSSLSLSPHRAKAKRRAATLTQNLPPDLLCSSLSYLHDKGTTAPFVAEHALALLLALLRDLPTRILHPGWTAPSGTTLYHKRILLLGYGATSRHLISLLTPFSCRITVVRRHLPSLPPVSTPPGICFHPAETLPSLLPDTDVLVLACALTPSTHHLIDGRMLALLPRGATVVNVARGAVVHTPALVSALQDGTVARVGLDVVEHEPVPRDHALWQLGRRRDGTQVVVTPHTAVTPEMLRDVVEQRVVENVERWCSGTELVGVVDPELGY